MEREINDILRGEADRRATRYGIDFTYVLCLPCAKSLSTEIKLPLFLLLLRKGVEILLKLVKLLNFFAS